MQNNHIVRAFQIDVFFRILAITLSFALLFEAFWELLLNKEPLNNYILIAYFVIPLYFSFIKTDDFKKTLDTCDKEKELKKIKARMKKTIIFLLSISFVGSILLLVFK